MTIVPGSPAHRARVIAAVVRNRDEILQMFADVDHWNRSHPTEEPIDPDPDGQLRRLLDGLNFTLAVEQVSGGRGLIEPLPGCEDDRSEH